MISSNFTRNSGRFPVSTFVCTFCWFTRTLALFSRVGHKKFPLRTRLLVNVINLVGNGNRLNGQKNNQRVAFGLVLMKTTRTLKNGGKICPSSVNIERNKTKNNYFRCPFVDVRCVNRKVSGCRRESASQVKVDGTFFIRREMFFKRYAGSHPGRDLNLVVLFFFWCAQVAAGVSRNWRTPSASIRADYGNRTWTVNCPAPSKFGPTSPSSLSSTGRAAKFTSKSGKTNLPTWLQLYLKQLLSSCRSARVRF